MASPSVSDDLGKLILRLSVGGLILLHGIAKLNNIDGTVQHISGMVAGFGLPPEVAYGVFLGEVIAPVMVILGILTRLGGLMIAVNMIAAIVLVHMADLMVITEMGGWALELQGLFLFGGLAIMFLGAGRIAVSPDRYDDDE